MDRPAKSPEDFQHVHDLTVFAEKLRGKFLNGTAWLEVLLTDIIANYFCADKDRRMLFFSEVANRMRFTGKTALLEKILRSKFPGLHEAHPKLREKLDSLGEFRNMLAHNHIDTSAEAVAARKQAEVSFIKYKLGEMTRVVVSATEAQRRAKEANELRGVLLDLQRRFHEANLENT